MDFLTSLNDMITGALGPMGPVLLVAGLAVLMVLVTIPFMLRQRPDPLEKLKNEGRNRTDTGGEKAQLRQKSKGDKLKKYANFLEPQDAKQLSDMRLKLLQAGYRSREAVRYYHFAQFALGIGGLILGVLYLLLFLNIDEATMQQKIMYVLGPGAVGYMAPKYWVTRRVEERKQEIMDGFPDSLDMLLVCVEAGQSLNQAILRVARELRASYPALADEYEIVSHEMKAGKDKASVLSDMGERCGIQDISSFTTVLIQSQTFGTSISEALRVYAEEMRDKRVMRAEEKANKLPTKMTLVTMMFTVPPLLIILVGPSVVGLDQMGEFANR
jgi:tight adherence protein C